MIKPILTKGIFYGISPLIHLHVDEDSGAGVIIACNLSSREKKVNIKIDISDLNLMFQTIQLFTGIYQKIETPSNINQHNKILKFEVNIPSLSPIIVILN